MDTVTFTQAEIDFVIESLFLYGFIGMLCALLLYDAISWFSTRVTRAIIKRIGL